MSKNPQTPFQTWLTQQFLAWQTQQNAIRTLADFADYLGVGRAALSMWLLGSRTPSRKMAAKLAEKLGAEVYDLLGFARPDEQSRELLTLFDACTPEKKAAMLAYARNLHAQP